MNENIHACWETCECDGCEKIRKDKRASLNSGYVKDLEVKKSG